MRGVEGGIVVESVKKLGANWGLELAFRGRVGPGIWRCGAGRGRRRAVLGPGRGAETAETGGIGGIEGCALGAGWGRWGTRALAKRGVWGPYFGGREGGGGAVTKNGGRGPYGVSSS